MSKNDLCQHDHVQYEEIISGDALIRRWACHNCGINFWPEGVDMHRRKRRDYFAAAALGGLCHSQRFFPVGMGECVDHRYLSLLAYKIADAMLAESEKEKPFRVQDSPKP